MKRMLLAAVVSAVFLSGSAVSAEGLTEWADEQGMISSGETAGYAQEDAAAEELAGSYICVKASFSGMELDLTDTDALEQLDIRMDVRLDMNADGSFEMKASGEAYGQNLDENVSGTWEVQPDGTIGLTADGTTSELRREGAQLILTEVGQEMVFEKEGARSGDAFTEDGTDPYDKDQTGSDQTGTDLTDAELDKVTGSYRFVKGNFQGMEIDLSNNEILETLGIKLDIRIEIYEDSTFEMVVKGEAYGQNMDESLEGTWEENPDGTIDLTSDGSTITARKNGRELIISEGGQDMIFSK